MDKGVRFRCAIYMGSYGINIYSNYPKTFDMLRKGSFIPFIPEYRCVEIKAQSDYSIIYIEDYFFSARIFNHDKTLEIKGPVKDIVEAATIPFRAFFMLEQQREKDGIFATEGAGISKQEKAILLMGKRGAGKTSLVLELCRKHNYKLIGDDLVLIGFNKNGGYFFDGIKMFTIRFTTVKYHNTDLQKLFKKSLNEWVNKIRVYPDELGISAEKGKPKIIKIFYIHLLNKKSAPLYVQKIQERELPNMGRLYLYKEFSSYIRGVNTPFIYSSKFHIGGFLPSLDKPEYHRKRVEFIDWLIEKIGFYFISGSIEAICSYINKQFV